MVLINSAYMNPWNNLTQLNQLEEIIEQSETQPTLIFKHSTRCSISTMVLDRLNRGWKAEDSENLKPYFLDLLSFRDVSNRVAEQFGVVHESPQVLVISKGKCIYSASQQGINLALIRQQLL